MDRWEEQANICPKDKIVMIILVLLSNWLCKKKQKKMLGGEGGTEILFL